MMIICSNCKTRSPQLAITSSSTVTQYQYCRCSCCGYVFQLVQTTINAHSVLQGHQQQKPKQHSVRRRASNWFHSHLKQESKSPRSTSPSSSSSSTTTSMMSSFINNSSGGRKRALLCGVTYKQRKYKLRGTHNDVMNMNDLLINTFNFPEDCVRILSDVEQSTDRIPTKKNIEQSLKWLVEGCEAGDSLVFYFSGHGLRQPDFKDDEVDGFDETICPLDFMEEGMILDNDINSTIVHPLKKGVTLHAIVDACHSGTILDLLYVYDHNKNNWKDNRPPSGANKSTNGGLAICISACEDDKMAADTTAFNRNAMNGAMTYILIETVKKSGEITYGFLLDSMQDQIEKINGERCLNSRILRKVFRHKIIQEPLLSSSKKFDVYNTKFIL